MLSRLGPASSLAASFFFHFLTESMCLSLSEKKAPCSAGNLDQDLSLLGKWPALTLKASRLSFLTTAKS